MARLGQGGGDGVRVVEGVLRGRRVLAPQIHRQADVHGDDVELACVGDELVHVTTSTRIPPQGGHGGGDQAVGVGRRDAHAGTADVDAEGAPRRTASVAALAPS